MSSARPARFAPRPPTGQDFEDYFLKRELLMGIFEKGFEKPSPVQERAIPIILQNRNVLARAKNGTGKTAAFIIPCLEKTDVKQNYIQVLILIPTRELALQTSAVVRELGKHMGVECMVSTGGTSLKDDIMRLYNPVQILVGTPGRILDLADKGVAELSKCQTIIMDEVCGEKWPRPPPRGPRPPPNPPPPPPPARRCSGRQVAVAGVPAARGEARQPLPRGTTDLPVLGHIPGDCEEFQRTVHSGARRARARALAVGLR